MAPALRDAFPLPFTGVDRPTGYRLVRSDRKTLAIQVRAGQEVLVRAPKRLPQEEIDAFVRSKAGWILQHWRRAPRQPVDYSPQQEARLRQLAKAQLPPLAERIAGALGLRYTRITITGARTRFGSCSAKGALSFSFRLMAYPMDAVEYVVLHEVAHLKHLNHSPAFYQLIARHMPDYQRRALLLKQAPPPLTDL